MMRNTLVFLAAAVVPACMASAATLGTSNTFSGTLDTNLANGNVHGYLSFTAPGNPSTRVQAFDFGLLETAMGTPVPLAGDLAGFAPLITSGGSQTIYHGLFSPIDSDDQSLAESAFFLSFAPGLGPNDLAGATLDEVLLVLTAYQVTGGGTAPFTVTIDYNFVLRGTIPAPGTGALAMLAAGCSLRRRRR